MRPMRKRDVLLLSLGLLAGAGCFDPDHHLPTAPEVQNALTLSVSANSIPADGVSTLVVTASIDPRAEQTHRTIVFTVNDGTFVEATSDPRTTVERSVDPSGSASVTLRSSRNVRPVEVAAAVQDLPQVVARTTVQFTEAQSEATIAFVSAPSTAPADTETRTPITVEIAPSLPTGRRSVAFTTSRGTFAQSQSASHAAIAGADHRARVDLVSPASPGEARLTATVDGVTVETFLAFVAALPETILVFPAKTRLEASDGETGTTQVQVRLLRDVGRVTETLITPQVVEEKSGNELPVVFRNVQPTTGETTFTLVIGAIDYRGRAEVLVRVPGASVVGRALIEIVNPAPPAGG